MSRQAGLYFAFCFTCQPDRLFKNSYSNIKGGSLGTHNCLGLALAKNARILVASTSEVYGDPLVHPQNEEYWGNVNPVGHVEYMMKPSVSRKPLQWLIILFIRLKPGSYGYSIPMAHGCGLMMEGLSCIYWPGVTGRRPYGFWRWQPDKKFLLCR